MTKKEKEAEDKELREAVKVMMSAISQMARRKASRYENEFLHRVRDMIDEEISICEYVNEHSAEYTAGQIVMELKK